MLTLQLLQLTACLHEIPAVVRINFFYISPATHEYIQKHTKKAALALFFGEFRLGPDL